VLLRRAPAKVTEPERAARCRKRNTNQRERNALR
jgi:hypothetical protein